MCHSLPVPLPKYTGCKLAKHSSLRVRGFASPTCSTVFISNIIERKHEILDLQDFMEEVHETAVAHGWWDTEEDCNVPTKIALIHSELSEALEEFRDSKFDMYYVPVGDEGESKPEGMSVELADAIIRILDLCAEYDIDIVGALKEKANYNRTRPFRHGGRRV